ncbi:MAG: hypothetical protein LUF87_01925 [Alistipes sp.]|nr:hypothetical protein [Alistipes sp.]
MREFSDLEKQLLRYLVQERPEKIEISEKAYASNQGYLILHDLLNIKHICLTDPTYNLIIGYEESSDRPNINIWDNIHNVILILKYLEKNFLISISTFSDGDIDLKYPGLEKDEKLGWLKDTTKENEMPAGTTMFRSIPIKTAKMKSNLSSEIGRYCNSLYYVTEELKQYVKRDFKTQMQLDVERQLLYAKIQMWVGVIAIIVAVVISLWRG